MPTGIAVHGAKPFATDNNHIEEKKIQNGDWAVHSWGNAKFPGIAAISAIATLQLSATLSEVPEDQIAMNKAAEYLTEALASQIRSFREAFAAGQ
jgi:hypothetical protein